MMIKIIENNPDGEDGDGDSGRLPGVTKGEGAGNAPRPSRATLTVS